jgi:hypothetical protein
MDPLITPLLLAASLYVKGIDMKPAESDYCWEKQTKSESSGINGQTTYSTQCPNWSGQPWNDDTGWDTY